MHACSAGPEGRLAWSGEPSFTPTEHNHTCGELEHAKFSVASTEYTEHNATRKTQIREARDREVFFYINLLFFFLHASDESDRVQAHLVQASRLMVYSRSCVQATSLTPIWIRSSLRTW